jgi:hypothetical protein
MTYETKQISESLQERGGKSIFRGLAKTLLILSVILATTACDYTPKAYNRYITLNARGPGPGPGCEAFVPLIVPVFDPHPGPIFVPRHPHRW